MLEQGEGLRKVAETRMNRTSSRSHSIFRIEVHQKFPNDTEKKGLLNLVDLAGSENVKKSAAEGETLEEAIKINLSLSCLGKVIHSLTTKSDYIPYRDSKLTRILQESLGGNYKTSLLVTCSPHSSQLSESISTLKFAQRAKTIQNKVKMNIKKSPAALQKIIDTLINQIQKLKKEIKRLRKKTGEQNEEQNEERNAEKNAERNGERNGEANLDGHNESTKITRIKYNKNESDSESDGHLPESYLSKGSKLSFYQFLTKLLY